MQNTQVVPKDSRTLACGCEFRSWGPGFRLKYTVTALAVLPSFHFGLLSLEEPKSYFSSFTMLPRALTYSPIQEIDEDDSTTEKLLGHWLSPRVNHKISRYRSFWNHYWAYFTHGALLLVLIFFFCLWMRARVQILKFAVYCKSHFVKVQKQTTWNLSTAPANVAVEYYKELTVFNGTFNHPSVYRGYPTPEIDAAWRRISQDGEDCITLTLIHATDCQLSS